MPLPGCHNSKGVNYKSSQRLAISQEGDRRCGSACDKRGRLELCCGRFPAFAIGREGAGLRTPAPTLSPSTIPQTHQPNMQAALARTTRLVCSRSTQLSTRSISSAVESPIAGSSSAGSFPASASRQQPRPPQSTNRYIVRAPTEGPQAARHSAKSSRIKGRTPSAPRKALSLTELTDAGTYAHSDVGQVKIYLPSVFVRLVRNTGAHADDPYTATFRVDLRLTKPDITNYLKNIYGLNLTSIRTANYLSPLKRNPIGGGYSRAGGIKNYKKVVVTMTEPFWYPEERSRAWCNEHFERDRMEEMRDRKMLKIGDGQKYGVGSWRYKGATKPRAERERLAKAAKEGGLDTTGGDGKASLRLPNGLKKHKNVVRARAERAGEEKTKVQTEIDRLREAGW